MKKHNAIVQWTDPKAGGRKTVPTDLYSTPAQFEGHEGEWWSVRLQLYQPMDAKFRIYYADVWFLSPDAPHDWLKPGARFRLHEGDRVVGIGECT